MLTGCFDRVLDDKLRLAIPKRLRDAILASGSREVYLAPGTDGSIAVYPEHSFQRMANQLDQAPPHGRNVRAFSRMFYARAQSCELDGHGRIRIPAELAQFARIQRDVVLIGVRDHLEVWDRQRWQNYVDQADSDYDQIAELAFRPARESNPPDSPWSGTGEPDREGQGKVEPSVDTNGTESHATAEHDQEKQAISRKAR